MYNTQFLRQKFMFCNPLEWVRIYIYTYDHLQIINLGRKLQFMLFYAVKFTSEVIDANLHKLIFLCTSSPSFSSWCSADLLLLQLVLLCVLFCDFLVQFNHKMQNFQEKSSYPETPTAHHLFQSSSLITEPEFPESTRTRVRQIGQFRTLISQESTHFTWKRCPQSGNFLQNSPSLNPSKQIAQSLTDCCDTQ